MLVFWNRALTQVEITSIYNGGDVTSGMFAHYSMDEGTGSTTGDSINSYNATLYNCTWGVEHTAISSPPPPPPANYTPDTTGMAVHFNGSSDYGLIPDNDSFSIPTTNQFTVSIWLRPDTNQFPNYEDTGYVNFFSKFTYASPNTAEWEFRIYNLSNTETGGRDNELDFYVFNTTGGFGVSGSQQRSGDNTDKWIQFTSDDR